MEKEFSEVAFIVPWWKARSSRPGKAGFLGPLGWASWETVVGSAPLASYCRGRRGPKHSLSGTDMLFVQSPKRPKRLIPHPCFNRGWVGQGKRRERSTSRALSPRGQWLSSLGLRTETER
jgi:hypothetical protein